MNFGKEVFLCIYKYCYDIKVRFPFYGFDDKLVDLPRLCVDNSGLVVGFTIDLSLDSSHRL